jgi:hypothetical protein
MKQMAILQFDIDDAMDNLILQMLINLVLLIKKQKLISTMRIKTCTKEQNKTFELQSNANLQFKKQKDLKQLETK